MQKLFYFSKKQFKIKSVQRCFDEALLMHGQKSYFESILTILSFLPRIEVLNQVTGKCFELLVFDPSRKQFCINNIWEYLIRFTILFKGTVSQEKTLQYFDKAIWLPNFPTLHQNVTFSKIVILPIGRILPCHGYQLEPGSERMRQLFSKK